MSDEMLDLTKLSADELRRLLWQERNKHEREVTRLTAQVTGARELLVWILDGWNYQGPDYERRWDIMQRDARAWLDANPEPKKDGDHD